MMRKNKEYKRPVSQLKRLILRMIDQDRQKANQIYRMVKEELDRQPQAMLLIGDKATQVLNNMRKQVQNLIRIYDIDNRKIIDPHQKANDIQQLLDEIEKQDKKQQNNKE